MKTIDLKEELIKYHTKKEMVQKDIASTEQELIQVNRRIKNLDQSKIILQLVAKQTQEEIEFHITDIVSLALTTVFDDPYEFKIDFVMKRGKTEAEIYLLKDGKRFNPMGDNGGGVVDIASFALRIALWTIKKPKSINTIVLDEPFRFLSEDLQPKAGEILSTLSKKLKLQFIIVTHNKALIDNADKIFTVIKKGKESILV